MRSSVRLGEQRCRAVRMGRGLNGYNALPRRARGPSEGEGKRGSDGESERGWLSCVEPVAKRKSDNVR